jgi:hypothetical protein
LKTTRKFFHKTQLAKERRNRKQQHRKKELQTTPKTPTADKPLHIIEENNDDSIVQHTTSTKQTVQTKEEDALKDTTKPQTLRQIP